MQPPDTERLRGVAVTESEIWRTCEQLSREKRRITIPLVRQLLGSRGSNTTIGRYIDTWRSSSPDRPPADQGAPVDVPLGIEGPMRALWNQAVNEASASLAAERQAFESEREALQVQHQLDREQIEATESRNRELGALFDRLLDRIERLEQRADASAQETVQAVVDLGVTVKEALKPLHGLQALTDQISTATAAIEALQTERIADRESAAVSSKALADEMAKLADRAEGNMAFMERQVADAKATHERQQTGFADLRRLLSDRHNVLKTGLESLGAGIETIERTMGAISKTQDKLDQGQIEFAAQIAAVTERVHRNEGTLLSSIRAVEEGWSKPLAAISAQIRDRDQALHASVETLLNRLPEVSGPAPSPS